MHRVVLWLQGVLVPMLGPFGLFVVAFFDSSFVSLPEINDLLVVTAAAAHPARAWLPVAMATLGSVAGCSVLWVLGRRGGESLLVKRFGEERVRKAREAFRKWDILTLAVPALLPPPMPFKIFVLSAGVFGFDFKRFALTLLVARGLRYAFWGSMGVIYGARGMELVQRFDHWFDQNDDTLVAAAGVLTLLVLLVMYRRSRRAEPAVGGVESV